MSFKKNKYQVIRGAISKEVADIAYRYLQVSAEADNWMLDNGITHAGNKLVGNNRMAVAKELGIKEIPIIVNIYDPTFKLKGRELKTDDEIRSLFRLGKDLQIRRDKKGQIDQIMPPWYIKVQHKYV